MIKRINGVVDTFKSYDMKTLESLKYTILVFIVINMIGLWWYMEWKRLSMALMIVSIIFFAVILLCVRRLDNMTEQNKSAQDIIDDSDKKKKDEDKKEDEDEDEYNDEMDLGIPSSEEYNKRLEKAIGPGI